MAKRWYYKDANGNKVPVPQYKINADDYYTKAMSDSRYYEKSATDTLLNEKVSKSDIVQSTGTSETAVMSQKAVSDIVDELESQVIYDVTANNSGATFDSLSALLSNENLSTLIPSEVRCGGMSIRFVQSSDNKYVQCRLMSASFSTKEIDWQNVDEQLDILYSNISELGNKTLDFSVIEGQGIPTSTKISIQKSAGQYVAFELKSDVDISYFFVVYIKPTGGSSVTLKYGLRTNTKYYMQLPEDIVSLAVYAVASSVKGSGNATFVVYGEIGSVDAKYGQETIKNNIVLESLIDKKTIGIVSFQNGSYLDQNGELVADNLGYYSDYIPVTQGDKFKYSGKSLYTNPCIYVILDMYKRALSYNNNTGTFSDLEVEIEDASAAYIRFGSYGLAPSAERVYLDSTKNYIDEKIADVNSKLPELDVRPKHLYNLFDPSTAIIGKYVKPQDGTLDDSTSNVASDYIEVINGESYSFPVDKSLFGTSLAAQIAMYNASKTFIGVVTGTYAEDNANILTIVINNANCKYIRTTAAKHTSRDKAKWKTGYDTYMVINSGTYPTRYYPYGEISQYLDGELSVENNSLVNPLFGKSVIFDGDSICAANDDTNKYGWAGRIGTRNRMMWNNFAVGGGTFTKIAGKHVISETDYGNANPDYIIIEGGTNDADNIGSIIGGSIPAQYGSYLPTGYTDEFTTSTYCGAIESLFKRLLSTYPKAKIGVIIAQKMGVSNNYTPTGNNRRAYFETLIKLCEKWGIPYINLWDRGRLNPRLSAYYTADNPNSFYTDGQHLTPNGYDVITPIIEEWMKTL